MAAVLSVISKTLSQILKVKIIILFIICYSSSTNSEIIPSFKIKTYTLSALFTFNDERSIVEDTWQNACTARGLEIVLIPGAKYCLNAYGNAIYVQQIDICSDNSYIFPETESWCDKITYQCPNSTWTLSDDKSICSRPDDDCWKDIDNVSEEKLLAAIAYGEAHRTNVYEEMAGIASASVRRRDATHAKTINELVKKYRTFSYVVYDHNQRFIQVMCKDAKNFKDAYTAAANALNYGKDYSNGGCFWDGYDLKISGIKHYKYRQGFRYAHSSHNIFSAPEPLGKHIKGSKGSYYDVVYISTAAQGKTIFWKLDDDFLEGEGAIQCR